MVMKLSKWTKNHKITHIVIVDYVAYKLFLNKMKFQPSENKMIEHGNFIIDN